MGSRGPSPTDRLADPLGLYRFQAEAVAKLTPQAARLIGDDPGLGKTVQAIGLDLANRHRPALRVPRDCHKTLVVAPLTAKSVWQTHLTRHARLPVHVLPAGDRDLFLAEVRRPGAGGYFVVHWQALRLPDVLAALAAVEWFHVVADEVHYIKNKDAQVTKNLKYKVHTFHKTGLSGTAADNKPEDLWSILHWLKPDTFSSYWDFVHDHLRLAIDPSGYHKTVGLREAQVRKLHKTIRPWYVRRLKTDVLHELPDKYYSEIWVDLPPVQRRGYDQIRRDMLTWVAAHRDAIDNEHPLIAGSVAAQLTRLQQFAIAAMRYDGTRPQRRTRDGLTELRDVPVFTMTEPSVKLDAAMDLITNACEQIVVFSQSKQAIHLLADRLTRAGIPASIITGDTSTSHHVRGRIADDFQQGRTRVFAGTIRACGEALTLTAASTVIFLDRDWNPSKNRQAEDRSHRIGQKNALHVIDIMARNTVDLGRHQRIEMKWQWLQQMLGDKTPTILLPTAA